MRITSTDAHLAAVYYDVLLDHVRKAPGAPIRYKEVLERARAAHPSDSVVAAAVPVSMGRRLGVIADFVRQHGLPPMTCIVVNDSGRPGPSYRPVHGSWEADMEAVAAYDWGAWKGRWDIYVGAAKQAAVRFQRRTESEARQLVFNEYRAGRVPALSPDDKERLVDLLMQGLPVQEALQDALDDLGGQAWLEH